MSYTQELFLIVDDEPDMCWVLENILQKNGISCEKALDGHSAMGLLSRYRFKSVFLDAKLPDIDGLDLARRIREIDPDIPIFLVSGYFYKDDPAVRRALDQARISGFISKPFQNSEILNVIKKVAGGQ